MPDRPLVFVLMPFDPAFDDVWNRLIKDPLEAIGFDVRRADSLFDQQNILRTIVRGIAEADLIVADVTGLNENVLYELGIAHALGKRCVMIAQSISELPFDLRPYRANEYSTDFVRAPHLAELMSDVGKAVLSGQAEFGTPILDFAPEMLLAAPHGAPTGGSPAHAAEGARREHAPGPPADESGEPIGMLELDVDLRQTTSDLIAATEEIAALSNDFNDKVVEYTERMDDINDRLGDQAAGALLMQANQAAEDFESYAGSLVAPRERLATSVDRFVELADLAARLTAVGTEEEARAAEDSAELLEAFGATLSESYDSTMGFTQTLLDAPHMSKDLTRATKRTATEVGATAAVIRGAHAEVARVANLLRQRVDEYRQDPR